METTFVFYWNNDLYKAVIINGKIVRFYRYDAIRWEVVTDMQEENIKQIVRLALFQNYNSLL